MWEMVDGNKTLIGLFYFATIDKYLPAELWASMLSTIAGIWTGVGITHKGMKWKKQKKSAEHS